MLRFSRFGRDWRYNSYMKNKTAVPDILLSENGVMVAYTHAEFEAKYGQSEPLDDSYDPEIARHDRALFRNRYWSKGPLIAGLFYYLVASSTYVLPARATSTPVLVTNC